MDVIVISGNFWNFCYLKFKMRVFFALYAASYVSAVPIGGASRMEVSLDHNIQFFGSLLDRAYDTVDLGLSDINYGVDTAYAYVFSEEEADNNSEKSLPEKETVVKNVGFVEAAIIASNSDPDEPTYC